MTYLVGLKRAGQTTIVADTAVTMVKQREVMNLALKTGGLFPGCIYGLAGSAEAARQFVIDGKRALTGRNTLSGFWSDFRSFAAQYHYSRGRDFSAVLCARNSGECKLFHFSPTSGLTEHDNLVTLGSGKPLLDEDFADFMRAMGDELVLRFSSDGVSAGLASGAVASLWLTQRTQGDEVSELEAKGIGGVFHFSYQTPDMESRQPPGVILLTRRDPADGTVRYWIFRVAFVRAALVVHCGSDQTIRISMDEAVWPKAAELPEDELSQLFDEINREAHQQPMYDFWGMGVADRTSRHSLFLSIGRGAEIDWSGTLGPMAREVITRTFDLEDGRLVVPIEWKDRVLFSTAAITCSDRSHSA